MLFRSLPQRAQALLLSPSVIHVASLVTVHAPKECASGFMGSSLLSVAFWQTEHMQVSTPASEHVGAFTTLYSLSGYTCATVDFDIVLVSVKLQTEHVRLSSPSFAQVALVIVVHAPKL